VSDNIDDLVTFRENADGSMTIIERVDVSGMGYPMRCKWCGQVHDAGPVEIVQRYSDCSVWRCPHCGVLGDDRPLRWGGSFEHVPRPTSTTGGDQ